MHTKRRRSVVGVITAATTLGALLGAASASAMEEPPTLSINEVEVANDWIEITNTGDEPVDVSGYVVKDDQDDHVLAIPDDTVVDPGGFLAVDTDTGEDGFGLGKEDVVRLFRPGGTTLVDSFAWTAEPTTSHGRCPDGTGEFVVTVETSKGAANVCDIDAADAVVINEVESQDGDPGDWVELANTATVPVDLSGLVFSDADDEHAYVVPEGTSIEAGGHVVLDEADFGFGLGGEESARLFAADGTTVIDSYSWTEHATDTTYGRCADAVGDFAVTAAVTKGAANDCAPPPSAGSILVNEVESNGDDTDWVELVNVADSAIDLSGFVFRDNDDSRGYELPAGSVVPAGGFFVVDQLSATNPGFDFGLGNPDQARLFAPDGATLVASYEWEVHAAVTYGRCPDGTGEFRTTSVSTKGGPNDCSAPVRINEIESDEGEPGDWVELTNVGAEPVDLGGFVLKDGEDDHSYAIPAGTAVEPGAFIVLDELTDGVEAGFDFGLGGGASVRLFAADGTTVVDSHTWASHATTTYGRCPDGTGEFLTTSGPTKGAANVCPGILSPSPWPGGAEVVTLDDESTFSGDLSGLDYEPSATSSPGTVWAVENGNGLLYKIVSTGDGGWAPATDDGWAAGKTLRYPDGTGAVDAEGVSVAGGPSAEGGVYVASERNNDDDSVSRPSLLRYEVTGTDTELVATDEWALAADFPGLGANLGLEGVTWVPDTFLVENGFVDETTGAAYDPAAYTGHGDGLFFVGVEGTASVYAYALLDDGGFQRIATIATDFELVADVQFDADRGALWVVCDEACGGRTALYSIAGAEAAPAGQGVAVAALAGQFEATAVFERPAGMDDVANEGFAFADAGLCVDGAAPTFYADDNDTDGFSLRSGTIDCTVAGDPDDPGDDDGSGDDSGSDAPGGPGDSSGGDAGGSGGADGSGDLPDTGAGLGLPLAAALILLLGGAGAVALRRRVPVTG